MRKSLHGPDHHHQEAATGVTLLGLGHNNGVLAFVAGDFHRLLQSIPGAAEACKEQLQEQLGLLLAAGDSASPSEDVGSDHSRDRQYKGFHCMMMHYVPFCCMRWTDVHASGLVLSALAQHVSAYATGLWTKHSTWSTLRPGDGACARVVQA